MDPAADHEHWTSTVVLGDGNTAVIRPITPGDAPALEQFHTRQSPDSRYLRFFSPKPTLSEDELERFTTVDFVDRVAFVVEQHGEFIAWASYERWKNREDAEVAFMVDDEHTGKGIATPPAPQSPVAKRKPQGYAAILLPAWDNDSAHMKRYSHIVCNSVKDLSDLLDNIA